MQAGLASSTIIDKKEGIQLTVGTDYTELGKLQYLIAQQNLTLIDTVYTEKVELQLMVPAEQQQEVEKKLWRRRTEVPGFPGVRRCCTHS